MDIAVEEAVRMDKKIEELLREGVAGSPAEAIKIIEERGNLDLKEKKKSAKKSG